MMFDRGENKVEYGGDGWNRTTDTGLMRALLCL